MYKPHLKTQDGVQSVTGDLHDIVENFYKSKGIDIIKTKDLSDELFDLILNYIDNLAGSPNYSNYN